MSKVVTEPLGNNNDTDYNDYAAVRCQLELILLLLGSCF